MRQQLRDAKLALIIPYQCLMGAHLVAWMPIIIGVFVLGLIFVIARRW
jgi:hypothetical protein